MPPLDKGRWPSEARSEGWLRCRERYRCDRRVTTGTLQQKMGRIAPYTQRYSVPLRLHPPVSFADSPPCQGGPRGCCGVATIVQPCQRGRASCLPLIRGGGRAKRGRKGGYVAGSDIVAIGELRQERCNRRWDVSLLIRNDTPSLYVSTPQSASLTAPLTRGAERLCGIAAIVQPCQRGRASCLPLLRVEQSGGLFDAIQAQPP